VKPVEHPVWLEKIVSVDSDVNGIFYPVARRGTYAEKGMKVGYVTDYLNRPIQDVIAPEAGVITYIRAVPSLTKGASMVNIGVIKK